MAIKNKKTQWLPKKSLISVICLSLIGLIIFMIAYQATQQISLLSEYDFIVLDFVSSNRTNGLNSLFRLFTNLGDPILFIIIASLIALSWVRRRNDTWRPLLILLSMGLAALISSIIKSFTQNPRPGKNFMVPPIETGFSFPSNHTLMLLVFMLVAGYLLYSRYKKRDKVIWLYNWIITTIISTLIMSISRIYLGYHWLSDVVGSIGLGLIIFSFVILIDKYVARKT